MLDRNSRHPAATLLPGLSRRSFLTTSAASLAGLALAPSSLLAQPPSTQEPTLVNTPLGRLRGQLVDGVRVFRGIPFAQPPVGQLRFLPPVPAQPWSGEREALRFAAAAVQSNSSTLPQGEDCLYLNVWAPQGPGPFPVYVSIHGGGYTGGSSFAPIFDGSHFTRNGIVLVTVAYRLGVFGFLELEPLLGPSYSDSANNALRDLYTALDWVHHNIEAFGGDPTRVTIGGESAGAKATAALMAVPAASRLFQSAISESGGGERVVTVAQAAQVAEQFGRIWRTTHPSASGTLNDLLTAPATDLLTAQNALIAASEMHFPLRPLIGHALLPHSPATVVAETPHLGKRLLIGTNRDESAAFLGPHPAADPTARDLGNLPLATFNSVFARYRALYPEMTPEQLRIRAATAEEYWVPSVRFAAANLRSGGTSWMYRLDYAKPTGPMAGQAYHALDLSLVWQMLDHDEQADPAAAPLAQQMHTAWASFIRGEAPTAPGLPAWPAITPASRPTMVLAATPRLERDPAEAELRLWDGVL
ncbi:MAG: carboxylesterase/lipase family protein [Acidobacteriota bacterium]|nr:carboxylesterase/lipase family protein [Acidobacteriota bacterium]